KLVVKGACSPWPLDVPKATPPNSGGVFFRVDPTKSCGSETCLKRTDGTPCLADFCETGGIQTKGLTLTSKNQATTLKGRLRVNEFYQKGCQEKTSVIGISQNKDRNFSSIPVFVKIHAEDGSP